VLLDLQDHREQLVLKVHKDRPGSLVSPERQGHKDPLEPPEPPDLLVLREQQDRRALKDRPELLV
jgi:hypothetical protein